MANKYQLVNEMANETIKYISQSSENWIEFLNTASNNYKYSFSEQVLIYAQKANATACADIETWNKRLKRWVNKGAKGIALLSIENGRSVLRHVFDISDTHSGIGQDLKLWEVKPSYTNGIIETLENSFGNLEIKDTLAEAIYSSSINLVEDNFQNYLVDLKEVTEGSFLQELNDIELESYFRGILANSIAYMTMKRCGIDPMEHFSLKISIIDITLEDLNNITPNNLEKYIIFLNNILDNDIKTRNRKLASLKKFFEYLETNNFISLNPARNMTSGRVEKRIPKHLSLIESKQLLSNIIKSNNRFKIRNYAITCVFLNCSLRLSELTSIDLSDLKLDDSEQTLRVHGKGNKERLIYLNAAVCEAIICYLQVRPCLGKDNKDHDALFISGQNKRISNRTVQTIIKDELLALLDENPYKEKYHTHTLRHTGATLLYNEKDINIFVLKRILGHECLDATEIYTHISDKKLKYIMENCTISSILERNGGQR